MKKLKETDVPVYLMFIFFSILFMLPICHLRMSDDLAFHVNRIQELSQCLRRGSLPQIYTYTFGKFGYPIGIFYPQLTIIPFAIFSMILHSTVKGIYVGIIFFTFLTLTFTYIVSKKLWQKSTAIWISIIYTFSCYRFIDMTTRFALGEALGMTFLPLAFYGLYAVMKGCYKDWPYLAFGLAAIMLSHILSTLIVVIFLTIVFIGLFFFIRKDIKERFIALIKAVLTFIVATLTFTVPFLIQNSYQKIVTPGAPGIPEVYSAKRELYNTIFSSCGNELAKSPVTGLIGGYTIGLTEFLVIVIGIIMFKKLDNVNKSLLVLGALTYFLQYIPQFWKLVWKTPLKNIQFPWRTLMVASFFLAVVGGNLISILMTKKNQHIIGIISLAVILIPWGMGVYSYEKIAPRITDISKISPSWGISQYTPSSAQNSLGNVANHVAFVNQKPVKLNNDEVISSPNELAFRSSAFTHKGSITLPLCYYKGLKAYQNGILLDSDNSRGIMVVKSNGESNTIRVKYQRSLIEKAANLISLITWLVMFGMLIMKKTKKKNDLLGEDNLER